MSKLAAIKKKIAELEAEAERITRHEMSGAIAKVKEIMADFGLTIEHIQSAVNGRVRKAAKQVQAKRAGRGVAKYVYPKSGKTWSGFGRAPAWIAGAKNRDAFLVGESAIKRPVAGTEAPVAKKKAATRKSAARKVTKSAAKKAVAVAKKADPKSKAPAAAKKPAAKKPAAKKAASKVAAKKSAKKRAAPVSAAAAPTTAERTVTSAA
jgi:DNA-binding protein H-NS